MPQQLSNILISHVHHVKCICAMLRAAVTAGWNLYFYYSHTNHYYYSLGMRLRAGDELTICKSNGSGADSGFGAGSGCLGRRCRSWVGWALRVFGRGVCCRARAWGYTRSTPWGSLRILLAKTTASQIGSLSTFASCAAVRDRSKAAAALHERSEPTAQPHSEGSLLRSTRCERSCPWRWAVRSL